MANLVTVEANAILNATHGQTAYTAPTTPIKVALNVTPTASTAATAGTEASGGAGPYARQTITFAAASAGSATSNLLLTYSGMPACTVTGVDEYDSAGTPIRRWFGALQGGNKTVNAGDTFTIASGSYTKTLS